MSTKEYTNKELKEMAIGRWELYKVNHYPVPFETAIRLASQVMIKQYNIPDSGVVTLTGEQMMFRTNLAITLLEEGIVK